MATVSIVDPYYHNEAQRIKGDFLKRLKHPDEYSFQFFAAVDHSRRDRFRRGEKQDDTTFNYILYGWSSFEKVLTPYLMDSRVKSFIDVGCGAGDKVYLAKKIAPKVDCWGVELDPMLAMWGYSLGLDNVFNANAFNVDFSNWDLIYAYWPIPNHDLMLKLVHHIHDTMRPHAKIVIVGWRGPNDAFENQISQNGHLLITKGKHGM